MMKLRYRKIVFVLSLAGFLFSGYLSLVKLFTSTCALKEPCPYFLGYPVCWYGFLLFTILLIASIVSFCKGVSYRKIAGKQIFVSGVGILFALNFAVPEVIRLVTEGSRYALGLPTCVYGLVFYIAIFVLSILNLKATKIVETT